MARTNLESRRPVEIDLPPEAQPTTQEIAERAYGLFLERGGDEGHDLDDWLRAERELADAKRRELTAV
jgi:hypothetical protein